MKRRGGRKVPLKANADEALKTCPTVTNVIVAKVTGRAISYARGPRPRLHRLMRPRSADCRPRK